VTLGERKNVKPAAERLSCVAVLELTRATMIATTIKSPIIAKHPMPHPIAIVLAAVPALTLGVVGCIDTQ
jgi:hypothetical protein